MANLTDLPVELLLMISESGDSTSNPFYGSTILEESDIASLALTNRRLYQVFNRILYKKNEEYNWCRVLDEAVRRGNLDTLKVAASFQIEPSEMGSDYFEELLQSACSYGYLDIAEWLLDRGAPFNHPSLCDISGDDSLRGCGALWAALERSREDTSLLMLSRGSNPLYTTEQNTSRSALHYAARFNVIRVVEYLVKDTGLSINMQDLENFTPLRYAMRYIKTPDTDTAMIRKLIELGADVNTEIDGEIPLTSALMRGKYRHAAILLDAGSKIKPDQPARKAKYPIHALIFSTKSATSKPKILAQKSILQRMIDAGADLTEKYPQGHSPLEEAFLNGSCEITSHLLVLLNDKGAIDVMDLLEFITQNWDLIRFPHGKVEELFKYGGRMDVPLQDGRTLLQWAADNYHNIFYPYFLDDLLGMATDSMLNERYLNILLTEVATSRKYNFHQGVADIMGILISYGATIEGPDDVCSTVTTSIRYRNPNYGVPDSLFPIVDSGIPDENLPDLLTDALKHKSALWVNYLLDRIEPGFDPLLHRNPEWIHMAARWREPRIIRRLLEGVSSTDVNHLSAEGLTPLATSMRTYMCIWELYDTLNVLLEYGADPFLPKSYPVCYGEDYRDVARNMRGVSAFEIAMHDDLHSVAEEMWDRTAPEARPDLEIFIMQCANKRRRGYDFWMKWLDKVVAEEYYSGWVAWLKQIEAEDDVVNQDEEAARET
ncbi:ankyrin [Daldinia vernicosa]|uniref:ankyrin n=1 Tax=Daldinia vernicosa TaxID=114800 RepID=UPI0020081614|nr:ankyrin [Daldinia vernicosa]KAI0844798.1 ankyrin [Daldinia vernicosa]